MANSVNGFNESDLPQEFQDKIKKYEILSQEASLVREKDKRLIREMFRNISHMDMFIGIGFQRAYGSMLSGDYFDLFELPDKSFMIVFADISGHGLPAYTTLIRLRSAIILAVREISEIYERTGALDYSFFIKNISVKFTDIMDYSNSNDFASANFIFIEQNDDSLKLRFFNRSMLFPIVLRRSGDGVEVFNLNNPSENWQPDKGYLLGSDIKSIVGEDDYYFTPQCEFDIHQGDMIFLYTDGLTEAFDHKTEKTQYGDKRLEKKLLELIELPPQLIINSIFDSVYEYIGRHEHQKDDMTALLIDFPPRI